MSVVGSGDCGTGGGGVEKASGSSLPFSSMIVLCPVGVPSLDSGWATSTVGPSSVSGIPSFWKTNLVMWLDKLEKR